MHLPGDVSSENNALTLQKLLYVITSAEKDDNYIFLSQWSVTLISLPLPPPQNCEYLKLQPMQYM